MIKVAAFTSSLHDPSSRFRIRQFLGPLRPLGIAAVEYRPWLSKYAPGALQLTGLGAAARLCHALAVRRADLVWLNRELVTGHETIERFIGTQRLLDVDDAIWLAGRGDFARRIAARSAGVIAGNSRIAEHFQRAARRLWIVPTVVDTDVWKPAPRPPATFTIGWSGTHWNLPYLAAIEQPLARFLSDHRRARLLLVCDRRPRLRQLPADQVEFRRWSPASEVEALWEMSVALMPLADDEWGRAKCALKMICAMAVALPAVASPVGTADEILRRAPVGFAARTADEWYEALAELWRDPARGEQMGRSGRRLVEESYSLRVTVPVLAEIFRAVATA